MRTFPLFSLAFVLGLACLAGRPAVAQAPGAGPPDILADYTIASRYSTLTQTYGGAAGGVDYHLRGRYGFAQEWIGLGPNEPATSEVVRAARFVEPDIRAPLGPMLPAFIDVDELLNLEGLRGELLPLAGPFDAYRFQGRINDNLAASPLELGSEIDLYAVLLGDWMYLSGTTEAPAGAENFPEYQIEVLARRGRWADANDDGIVDAADYTLVRDGVVDGLSYADWKSQFGESAPDTAAFSAALSLAAASAAAAPAPEPAAATLLLVSAAPLAVRRRR